MSDSFVPCIDCGSLNHSSCRVIQNNRQNAPIRLTPKGLRCVHLRGCLLFDCCDMLDDCINVTPSAFPADAWGPG